MVSTLMNGLYIALAIFIAVIAGYMWVNWLSKGFLTNYLKCKMGRGKFILIRVRAVADTYYKTGVFDKDTLVYKNREKEVKRLTTVVRPDVDNEMGVFVVTIDDKTGNIIKMDGTAKAGTNPSTVEQFLIRIIMASALGNKKVQMIIILLVVVIILVFIAIYFGWKDVSMSKELLIRLQALNQTNKVI